MKAAYRAIRIFFKNRFFAGDLNIQLHDAAKAGNTSLCLALLGRGADVRAADDFGTSALHVATRFGHTSSCLALLDCDADVRMIDNDGWTALHMAAWFGRESICLALIERGSDVNAMDQNGLRPHHHAACNGCTSTCLILLEHGANPMTKTHAGQTALDLAIKNHRHNCAGAIESFVATRLVAS